MQANSKPTPAPSPHLTTEDLAARWRCTRFTISKKYRLLGLRPITIGKRLLFPVAQVEEAERRSMVGEALS
jgi:hypothetical protein